MILLKCKTECLFPSTEDNHLTMLSESCFISHIDLAGMGGCKDPKPDIQKRF